MELLFILGRVRWQEIRAPVCADSERLVVDGLTAESHAIRHLLRFLSNYDCFVYVALCIV